MSTEQQQEQPLVSVVTPIYNAEAFIEASLRSVLAQDYPNIEIVAVDDGSTDRTGEILRSLGEPVWPLTLPNNRGPAAARNAGMAAASGRFVVLLDADDALQPGALSALVRTALAHPEARFVIPQVDMVKADGTVIVEFPPACFGLDFHDVLAMRIPQPCGILIRDTVGSPPVRYNQPPDFEDRLYFGREDWVLWIDVAAAGVEVAHAPDARTHYVRQNQISLSSDVRVRWEGSLRVLEHGQRVASRVHGKCAGCRTALVDGRRALAKWCLEDDWPLIFGADVEMSRRVEVFFRVIRRRDRASTYLVTRTAAWHARDALKRRLRLDRA